MWTGGIRMFSNYSLNFSWGGFQGEFWMWRHYKWDSISKRGKTSPKVKGLYVESPEFNLQHGKKKGSLCFTFTLQSPGLLEVLLGSCPSIPRIGQHAFHISMLNALCMSVYGWLWIWPITAQTLEERWLFFKRPHGSLPSAGIWKRRGHQRW